MSQRQSSLMSELIWFELYDSATGHLYKNTSASSILRSSLVVPVVDQFRDAVHQQNSKKLSSFDASDLLVYKNKDSFDKRNAGQGKEEPLEEDSLVDDFGKSEEDALIVVVPNLLSEQDFPQLYRARAQVFGRRKSAFRRTLYEIASDLGGCYEKQNGERQNPFSYPEKDIMAINVLFVNLDHALCFISKVDQIVTKFSPFGELKYGWRGVEVVRSAKIDTVICCSDFVPDEDSPLETPRTSCAVTELDDDSPLFEYQRIENEDVFCDYYKADRAHIIDKQYCHGDLRKYQNEENNILALSKEAHIFFDANSNIGQGIPRFLLTVISTSNTPDPRNDSRYCVRLKFEAYNAGFAQFFFCRLKKGSTVTSDTTAETFVHVLDPTKFAFCLDWKAKRVRALWNFDPAVE